MLMNLYGYNKEYYVTLNNDIMQDYWHKLILPHLQTPGSVHSNRSLQNLETCPLVNVEQCQ